MMQVSGTFSMSWSEINALDLGTFDYFVERKCDAIDDIRANGKG